MGIPVFCFAAYSNVGKTTYLEKLIPILIEKGLRIAVIKHDCHGIRLDPEGTDTDRMKKAGADPVAILSEDHTLFMQARGCSLQECVKAIKDVDLIFAEGFKTELFPKITLYRKESGQPLAADPDKCFAIVTDEPLKVNCPQYPLDDPAPLADRFLSMLKYGNDSISIASMPLSLKSAEDLTLKHIHLLNETEVPLQEALGNILSKDVFAPIMQPPFNRSPLDGYAVRAEDILNASPDEPAVLSVIDKVFAGAAASHPVRSGQAVRIMTGAEIPEGADYVVRQEETDLGENTVKIYRSGQSGKNYCRKGEEYQKGDLLLAKGLKLDAAALAVAAGAGYTRLPVIREPRVAVFSVGNELQMPGEPLSSSKIFDSNNAYLCARLSQFGIDVRTYRQLNDEKNVIIEALSECIDETDIIITTGGVSVGEKDLMESALLDFGAEILYHGLDIKPGMPTMAAVKGHTLVMALSGNPFASAVGFELLVRPALAKMMGDPTVKMKSGMGIAANAYRKYSPKHRFLRAHLDDEAYVRFPDEQANGQMRSMIGCNCLIEIPAGTKGIDPGDRVSVYLL